MLAHFIDGVANLRPKGLCHYLFTIYMGRPVHGLGKRKANSGLVNFVSESRLSFVQISFIYQETDAKT